MLAVDRNKMEKLNLKMEKGNYVISKSMPNVRDQHPKMEIGQKQGFKYTYMYTYTFTLLFIQYNTVQNSTLQPTKNVG